LWKAPINPNVEELRMVDLNNLRFFYYVAEDLSFTSAASKLFVTQSAVWQRVKILEEASNLKLFGNHKGKIFLTEEGKILLEYARKIFKHDRELDEAISDVKEFKRGTLRLGVPSTTMPTFVSFLVDLYRGKYPNVKVEVSEGNSTELIKSLLDHQTEIALPAKIEDHPDIHFIPHMRETLVLIASPTHRFAKSMVASMTEVAQEPLIVREKGSVIRKTVMELYEENQYTPNIVFESSSNETIKQIVGRGDGISFLLETTLSKEIERRELIKVPIEGHEIVLDLYVAYLRDTHLSIAAKGYLEVTNESIKSSQGVPGRISIWPRDLNIDAL